MIKNIMFVRSVNTHIIYSINIQQLNLQQSVVSSAISQPAVISGLAPARSSLCSTTYWTPEMSTTIQIKVITMYMIFEQRYLCLLAQLQLIITTTISRCDIIKPSQRLYQQVYMSSFKTSVAVVIDVFVGLTKNALTKNKDACIAIDPVTEMKPNSMLQL